VVVWLTGLSGAGKSTIAEAVSGQLRADGIPVEVLDGDIVRQNLSKGLGYSKQDRDENVRRVGFVANLLSRHGVVVLVALVSPYREARDEVRSLSGAFLEVFVNAPVAECQRRDPKGLYGQARDGKLLNFTGVSDPYEVPQAPDVECHTDRESREESAGKVIDAIYAAIGRSPIAEQAGHR